MGIRTSEKPTFQIQMKAAGLSPETVRAGDLAALLSNLEGAIIETAKAQDIPAAYDPDEALVSLVRVESGQSSDLTFAVDRGVSPVVSVLAQAIFDGNFQSLPFKAQEFLHDLSVRAIQRRSAYEFHSVNGLIVAPAVISYEFPVPRPVSVETTSGTTTIWGHLVKVGGDDPKAIVRLRNGKLFPVRITIGMVNEIQEHKLIFKDIGLRGQATWRLDDWSMESFKANSITGYRPHETNPSDSFNSLAEASKGRWDDVDPVDFTEKLRSERD